MKPYYDHAGITIYHGDCRKVMTETAPNSVDIILTDPPYGLKFMDKEWDHGVPGVELWKEALRVAKPGTMMMVFGGTRTFHRLACAIEDAGWEIRDCLMWLYGQGFPKSLDISKAIDKAAGAERKVVGTRPHDYPDSKSWGKPRNLSKREGFFCKAEQVDLAHLPITAPATEAAKLWNGWGTALKPAWEPIILAMKPLEGTFAENAQKWGVAGLKIDGGRIEVTNHKGRWPANVILDEEAAAMLDEQTPNLHNPGTISGKIYRMGAGKFTSPYLRDGSAINFGDSGGASRFFYTAKATIAERGPSNTHPTVKPLALIKYLLRLLSTPTGGVVLDPFMGSGTTLVAAKELSMKAIGIDLNESYCRIAVDRLAQKILPFDDKG